MKISNYLALLFAALLVFSLTFNQIQHKDLVDKIGIISTQSATIEKQKTSIEDLREQLRKAPDKAIDTARESQKELSESKCQADSVRELKVKKPAPTEDGGPRSEEAYVDIDGKLPPELLRLLK